MIKTNKEKKKERELAHYERIANSRIRKLEYKKYKKEKLEISLKETKEKVERILEKETNSIKSIEQYKIEKAKLKIKEAREKSEQLEIKE